MMIQKRSFIKKIEYMEMIDIPLKLIIRKENLKNLKIEISYKK